MKTRLVIFVLALLLLPLAGFYLSEAQPGAPAAPVTADNESVHGAVSTSITLLVYLLVANQVVKRLSGNGPLDVRRSYYVWVSIASALLGWLLVYMNQFVASWTAAQNIPPVVQLLLYTPAFALLVPAVLVTQALLGNFPGSVRLPGFGYAGVGRQIRGRLLLPLVLFGLTGGALWPAKLYWLYWMSPLTLLVAMQLLWCEDTVFTRLKFGEWGRVVCTALAGILVCNIAAITYQSNAYLQINLPNMLLVQSGFALFGLLCLQLGDVLAEHWRENAPGLDTAASRPGQ